MNLEAASSKLPLVTVIVPTYKRPNLIDKALESLLNQTYPNIEIIVVDDNGQGTKYQIETERTVRHYVQSQKIRYIAHDTNRNGSAARNTGLKASSGQYVLFLDDDDFLYPENISMHVQRLENTDKRVGAAYCNSKIIHYQNITHRLIEKESNVSENGNLCRKYILGLSKFNTSMIAFKRDALEYINGFDESFVRHQDYELMIRFFRYFDIVCTSLQPLAVYDQTSDRLNTPNSERDFRMKQKIMAQFTEDFNRLGITNEIGHHLWLQCALSSARQRKFQYIKKSIAKCREYQKLTFKDYILLIKAILVGYLKR